MQTRVKINYSTSPSSGNRLHRLLKLGGRTWTRIAVASATLVLATIVAAAAAGPRIVFVDSVKELFRTKPAPTQAMVEPMPAAPYAPFATGFNVSPNSTTVTAGDLVNFHWTFTAINGTGNTSVNFTIPSGWVAPQTGAPAGAGYVSVTVGSCTTASIGGVAGQVITVSQGAGCANATNFTIDYLNVTVPTPGSPPQTYTFDNSLGGDPNVTVLGATTTVVTSTGPSTFGDPVTFTATVSPIPGLNPSRGTVDFSIDGNTEASNVPVDASGQATYTTSALTASGSPHTVDANYSGNSNLGPSSGSLSGDQLVGQASQAINVTMSAPGAAVFNSTFNVAATGGGSGNPVVILGSGSCSGGGNNSATITMTSGTGTCTVSYNQAGDGNYSAAPQVTQNTSATKANATIVVTPYSVTYDGDPHTATGTATGVLSEDLSLLLNLSGTTHTNAGTYNGDTWSFAGDANYNSDSGTVDDLINKATATIVVTAYNVTYDANPHTATGTATGVDAEDLSGLLNLTGTTHTNAGTYTGDPWSFAGDTNYNSDSGTVDDVINKANATIVVTPYNVVYDANPHTATGTATGVGGADLIALLDLSGTTHVGAGVYNGDAWTFAGDTNYNSDNGTVDDVINKANASINVTPYIVTYDGNSHLATGTATGVVAEDLSGLLDLSGTTHTSAGTYNNDPWTFAGDANYNGANGTVNDLINNADQTATVTNSPQAFDGSPHAATVSCSGGGAAFNILTGGAASQTAAGVYPVTADCPATPNYNAGTGLAAGSFAIVSPTVVTLGDTNWHYYDDNADALIANHDFVVGPATAPLSLGSARFTGGPASGPGSLKVLFTTQYAGTKLADMTALSYSTYGDSGAVDPNNIPTLQFNVDYDLTDGDISFQGRVVFSPQLSQNGTVINNTWQSWNALDGYFWYSNSSPFAAQCTQAAPCTRQQMLTAHPFMGIHGSAGPTAGDYGFLLFRVQPQANSNADKLTVGVNATYQVFDFEPGTSTTTVTCPPSVVYNGAAQTPCTVSVTGAEGLSLTPAAVYANNTNAGLASASYTYPGDDNHTGSSDSENFTIDPAPVTATAGSGSGVYNGLAQAPSACAVSGAFTGDLTCVNNPASVGPNAGVYPINPNVSGTGLSNFDITSVPGSYEITQATPNCSSIVGYTGVYDGNPHGASGSCKDINNVDLTTLNLGATFINVPGGTANWVFTSTDPNYSNQSGSVGIVITDANQTATVTNSPQAYDGSPHSPTVTCSGGGVASNILADGLSSQTAAGVYAVTADCPAAPNYSAGTGLAAGNFAIVTPTVVTLGDTNWHYYDDFADALITNHDFVVGPATAPLSLGSARFTGGPASGAGSLKVLFTTQYAGTKLADISALSYSTYGDSGAVDPNNIPTLQFNVDYDLTDGNILFQGRVVFSPQLPQNGTVVNNTWQSWNALDGYFWYSNSSPFAAECTQAAPCTRQQMLLAHPNMGIHTSAGPTAGDYGFLLFRVQPQANSNADKLTVGVNTNYTVFDFEPGTSTTTVTCPPSVVYNGAAQTPCTVSVTGAEGLSLTPAAVYANNSNAGSASASYTYPGDDNHTGSSDSANFTIDPAPVTATAGSGSGVYNGLAQAPSACAVSGAFTGDLTCVNNPASVGPNVNVYPINPNVSGTGLSNFNIISVPGSYTISKANANCTITGYTVPYDANPHTATGQCTGVGGPGDILTGLDLSGTTHTNTGNYPTDPWTFTDVTGNYNNASGTVADAITFCPILSTPVVTSPTNVDYDVPVSISDTTGGGVISVDFTFTYDPAVLTPVFLGGPNPPTQVATANGAAFPNAIVLANQVSPGLIKGSVYYQFGLDGVGPLVYVKMHVIGATGTSTPLTLTDVKVNGNLVCSNPSSGSLSVVVAPTTTTVTSSLNPSTYGDNVTFTATVAATPTPSAGTVNFVIDGNPACTGVAVVGGIATCSTSALTVAGSPHSVTAFYSGTPDFSSSNGSLVGGQFVNPTPLLITASSHTVTYGDAAPVVTASYIGLVNGNLAPATPPTCGTTYIQGSPVSGSPYPTTCSGAVDSNYSITYAPGSVTVNPAALLITASSHTVTYGDAAPTITASYLTLVNGDLAPATPPTCVTTYTVGSPVSGSPYTTSCSGAVDSNYSITYANGTVTVNQAPLLITASSHTVTYGDAAPIITASYATLVNGELAPATPPTCGTTYVQGSPVSGSPYPTTCSGAVDNNYSITYASGTVTVNQAALLITASSHTVAYGDATPTITASYLTLVNGDLAPATPPTCSTTYTAGSPVSGSPYPTSCTGAVDNNYAITYAPGTVTVNKANSTTTIDCSPGSFVYTGSAIEPCTYTVTGPLATLVPALTPVPMGGYANNVAVGNNTASATVNYPGDANHNPSIDSETFSITSGTIEGTVTYAIQTKPVPNVLLSAVGSPPTSATTDGAGFYSMTNFGAGSYTVTPSKTTQPCGTTNGIFANDAGLVSQHVVGLITLSDQAQAAGRVSGLPTLSSFDAALIAQATVFNCSNFSNQAGQWKFYSTSSPFPSFSFRSYPSVLTLITGQDYLAYLMGDVNGDWNNLVVPRPAPLVEGKDAARTSVADVAAASGSVAIVPFRIENLNGKGIGSYQFDIVYNPRVIEPAQIAAEITGTLSEGLSVVWNVPEPGLLKVAVYGAYPVTGDGIFVNLRFNAIGKTGSNTELTIEGFRFNDGELAIITNGRVTVAAANQAAVRGRVLTATGQGLVNARVFLTSSSGERRSVISSSFGHFEFGGLTVGETYTVTVESKRFRFEPRTISITNSVVDLDLTAQP